MPWGQLGLVSIVIKRWVCRHHRRCFTPGAVVINTCKNAAGRSNIEQRLLDCLPLRNFRNKTVALISPFCPSDFITTGLEKSEDYFTYNLGQLTKYNFSLKFSVMISTTYWLSHQTTSTHNPTHPRTQNATRTSLSSHSRKRLCKGNQSVGLKRRREWAISLVNHLLASLLRGLWAR